MVYHAKTDALVGISHPAGQGAQTIAAVATPPGRGGIGVIRVSGPQAEQIGRRIAAGPLAPARPLLRKLYDLQGRVVDQGIVVLYRAPRSYTGEDVCEFQCHGSPAALGIVLEAIVGLGARLAEPGEYTRRAFENGKLDLAQAEAVADLINSSTEAAARSAMRSLSGDFSQQINDIGDELLRLRVYIEAAIDFPEEEIDLLADEQLLKSADAVCDALADLHCQAGRGVLLQEGITVAIAGQPNAGKSSVLNRFAGLERAIVAPEPGTTRDTVEISININGIEVIMTDTAGMRITSDPIESEGVKRAWDAVRGADLIVYVVDEAKGFDVQDLRNLDSLSGEKVIVVRNKIDLTEGGGSCLNRVEHQQVFVSAKKGDGFDELRQAIATLSGGDFGDEGVFLARRRHLDAIGAALSHADAARLALHGMMAGELAAEDLRAAHQAMGSVTGQVTAEDLLGEIFSSFCIGK